MRIGSMTLIGIVLLMNVLPLAADAAGVRARFELDDRRGAPFPSDRYTVIDDSHNTRLRVDLPKPDCGLRPSDCQDIDVINTLDGFNLEPRLSIPFDGPIEPDSVTGETVFLLSLGSALPGGGGGGRKIGINQVVWDVATSTLHVESDELLNQHTRYALIVTRGVHDALGDPVEASTAFQRFRHDVNFGQTRDPQAQEVPEGAPRRPGRRSRGWSPRGGHRRRERFHHPERHSDPGTDPRPVTGRRPHTGRLSARPGSDPDYVPADLLDGNRIERPRTYVQRMCARRRRPPGQGTQIWPACKWPERTRSKAPSGSRLTTSGKWQMRIRRSASGSARRAGRARPRR